jgi:hypothetical protein
MQALTKTYFSSFDKVRSSALLIADNIVLFDVGSELLTSGERLKRRDEKRRVSIYREMDWRKNHCGLNVVD